METPALSWITPLCGVFMEPIWEWDASRWEWRIACGYISHGEEKFGMHSMAGGPVLKLWFVPRNRVWKGSRVHWEEQVGSEDSLWLGKELGEPTELAASGVVGGRKQGKVLDLEP